jgi:putative mRNA 3-end processing factor
MIELYRDAGVEIMLPVEPVVERPRGTSFAGRLILAPPSARGTPWMRRLGPFSDALTTGLMQVRGVRRQRAYDRGFVLSDHADWPALLATVAETGAARVVGTHGHADALARYLGEAGLATAVMRTAWDGEAGSDDAE